MKGREVMSCNVTAAGSPLNGVPTPAPIAVSDGVTSVASVAPNLDFEASVGAVTDTGPRPVNADRFYTSHSPADGSWVIAVADGVGGHPEAADAAAAAVEGLPDRIESLDAMRDAFVAASDRVLALAPSWDDFIAQERADFGDDRLFDLLEARTVGGSTYRYLANCPLCTLYVAAWTPTGGLLVASMGDTLAFEVRWPADVGVIQRREHLADLFAGRPPEQQATDPDGGGAGRCRRCPHTGADECGPETALGMQQRPQPAPSSAKVLTRCITWRPRCRSSWWGVVVLHGSSIGKP